MVNNPADSSLETTAEKRDLLDRAIQVFIQGYCFTRSLTHSFLPEKVAALRVMRDAPRKSGSLRSEEWVANGLEPAEIDRVVRSHTRGKFAISLICGADEDPRPQVAAFKALGYRLGGTEALMIHRLVRIPHFDTPFEIARVQTESQAAALAHGNHVRPVPPDFFRPDSPLRQYMALDKGEVVGWVRSVTVEPGAWCADMFMKPEFRRRGIARAMLARMLADDAAAGARLAVLLAGHTGALLYPAAGYEPIGILYIFTPKKEAA